MISLIVNSDGYKLFDDWADLKNKLEKDEKLIGHFYWIAWDVTYHSEGLLIAKTRDTYITSEQFYNEYIHVWKKKPDMILTMSRHWGVDVYLFSTDEFKLSKRMLVNVDVMMKGDIIRTYEGKVY